MLGKCSRSHKWHIQACELEELSNQSATNVPGAIAFICLGVCEGAHFSESTLLCSERARYADWMNTLLLYHSEVVLKSSNGNFVFIILYCICPLNGLQRRL